VTTAALASRGILADSWEVDPKDSTPTEAGEAEQERDRFDGSQTVLEDGTDPRRERHDPPRPVPEDGETDPSAGDPEDRPTALWAPAAQNLFASGIRPRVETERERASRLRRAAGTPDTLVERAPEEIEEIEDDHPLTAADAARAARHDTEPGYASAADDAETSPVPRVDPAELGEAGEPQTSGDPGSDPLGSGAVDPVLDTDPEGSAGIEPEEQDTEIVSGEFSSSEALALAGHLEDDHDAREAEAARLLRDSVEVSGEEGEAARQLAEEARLRGREIDPSLTMVVEAQRLPRLSHECRVCGRRIASPTPIRFRGSIQSERGFRCEACSNVVCAAHAVRVSGFFATLFLGGRFRCVLCSPDALPPGGKKGPA
jgi:hypothetical protein